MSGRRATAAAAVAIAALLGPSLLAVGCASSEQEEFVVYFTPAATAAQKDALRDACPGVGRAVLEPRDRNDSALARTYPVRYDVTKAGDRERSDLTSCVGAQPGIRGVGLDRNGS